MNWSKRKWGLRMFPLNETVIDVCKYKYIIILKRGRRSEMI